MTGGDEAYRAKMVRRAKEFVLDGHTYRHRVDAWLDIVGGRGGRVMYGIELWHGTYIDSPAA